MKKLEFNFVKNANQAEYKQGFTLAEVLVTLGIIGVVSAMTVPTLMQNHQRKVYVTQLQKVYTELSQAAKRAITDNNAISLDETKYNRNHANGAKNFLHDYFNVVNDCGTDLTPCFGDSYTSINGTAFVLQQPVTVVSLASGAAISVFYNGFAYEKGYHGYLQMQVDVNGAEGPNIIGRDLFYMDLYSDGKVAEYYDVSAYDSERIEEIFASDCQAGVNYGNGCLSKIIQDGWTMDY